MLKLEHVTRIYRAADIETAAIDDLSLEVSSGERRRAAVGFVFQNFNLVDDLNVTETWSSRSKVGRRYARPDHHAVHGRVPVLRRARAGRGLAADRAGRECLSVASTVDVYSSSVLKGIAFLSGGSGRLRQGLVIFQFGTLIATWQ